MDDELIQENPDQPKLRPVTLLSPRRQDLCFIHIYLTIQHVLTELFNIEYPEGSHYKVKELFEREQI